MGGRDKATLRAPSGAETLLERLMRIGAELRLECVVVGGPPRLGLSVLSDTPGAAGPIGGLHALLTHALGRPVVSLACDMPYVTSELVSRLAQASRRAPIVAARDAATGKWQPWFARYDSARVLAPLTVAIAGGERSLQRFFATLAVEEFTLAADEAACLRDWDEPDDVCRT
jgi:molybdopterin-guanine dinucleotide biosynthesis protein A